MSRCEDFIVVGDMATICRVLVEWMRGNVVEVVLKFRYRFLNCCVEVIVTVIDNRMFVIYMMFRLESRIWRVNFWVGARDYGFMHPLSFRVTEVDARLVVTRTCIAFCADIYQQG